MTDTIRASAGGFVINGYWNKYANTWMVTLSKNRACDYGPIRLKAGDQGLAFNVRALVTTDGGKRHAGDLKTAKLEFYSV